jgi:hypothetical protein
MNEATAVASAPRGKPLPDGLFMPMRVQDIDGGKLLRILQKRIDEAAERLERHRQEAPDSKDKAVIALQIELTPTKDMDGHVDMVYACESKLPKRKRRTYFKASSSGRLLADAKPELIRARADEEQIPLFSLLGEPKGAVDPRTMTVIEDKDVAGSIGA